MPASSPAVYWPVPYKALALPAPAFQLGGFKQLDGGRISFTVSATALAPLTWLEAGALDGHFSDNAFTLHPCQPQTITFISDAGAVAAADLQRELTVTSVQALQAF